MLLMGIQQKKLGFIRLDMPDGYKHFSKTKPNEVRALSTNKKSGGTIGKRL